MVKLAIRIWFNHWFSTAYNIIKHLKNNEDGREFFVFGTNRNKFSAMLHACDYYEIEPTLEENEYIDYCLDFCFRNRIEVFIPKYRLELISKNLDKFHSIGTKVLVSSDYRLLEKLNDKAKFYAECSKTKLFTLPKYFVVNTLNEFKEAYCALKDTHRVCFKPVNSEGASGFRVIDDYASTFENLLSAPSHKISLREVCNIMESKDRFDDIMVMEYLGGYEYSIDCLSKDGTLYAAIPRKKLSSSVRFLENNEELISLAHEFNKLYKLPFVYNIQVRQGEDGITKLLEVNPRMSGGIHHSCKSGVNFPYLAVKLLLGENINTLDITYNLKVSQIEKEILVD